METKIKWNEGEGYITATYEGSGNGSAYISSDVNEGIDREQSIKVETTDKSVSATLVVSQEGLREVFEPSDGGFVLADGGTFNVLKERKQYTELNYIESSGTQYFDTGFTINTSTDEIELKFQYIGSAVYKWMYGEHDNGARFGIGSGDGTNKRNLAYGSTTYKLTDTQIYNSQHTFASNSNGVFIDDSKIADFVSFKSTSTLYLFNLNLNNVSYHGVARIWSYKHKRNGVYILDLIPAIDSNGVICMYNKANDTFLYNQGTGEFIAGPANYDLPLGSKKLNYIESTGTQYIDTLYSPNDKTSIELIASNFSEESFAASPSGTWLCGGRQGYLNKAFGFYYNQSTNTMYYAFGNLMPSAPYTTLYGKEIKVIKAKLSGLYIDSKLIISVTANTFTSPVSLLLFALNNNGDAISRTAYRIHSFKIWNDNIIVRNLIPALDINGVACMFDKVSGEFFYNKGTGVFNYE